jgi:hypothetical protein
MLSSVHAASILHFGPMIGYAVLALIAGGLALTRRPMPGWFWGLSLICLLAVVAQVGSGLLLFAGGMRPYRSTHLLYGLLALGGGLVQYGLHPGGLLRRSAAPESASGKARTLALISLTQAALIGRAWMTGLESP